MGLMEVRSECKIFVGNLVGDQTVGVRMILKRVSEVECQSLA